MKFVLDTDLVLWASARLDLLPPGAPDILNDPANALLFGVASVWEVAIKHALKREDFRTDPDILRAGLLESGYVELPISGQHAAAVARLPRIHRDPFDRLLVAQAMVEGITLLTVDPVLGRYAAPVQVL